MALPRRRERAGAGGSTGRTSSATSSTTSCSTRATGARSWRRRRPATWDRPSSAPRTSAARWKEAAAARLREGLRENGRAVDHTFWLTPGPRRRAGVLVRGDLAAGPLPLRRRRRHLGAVLLRQRRPAVPGVDGHRAGRHAGRSQAALDHRRPARPRAPLLRHVRAAGVHESLDRGRTWTPLVQGDGGGRGLRPGQRDVPRPALRPALPEQPRPAVPAESLRHLPDRPAVERVDAGREEHAEAHGRHRLPDGGAPARRGHRLGLPDGRHDGLAPHEPGGQALRPRDPQRGEDVAAAGVRPAGASGVVDGQAAGDDARTARTPSASTSGRRAASCGRAATRAAAGPASPGTCPRSTPWKRPSGRRRSDEGADPHAAALLHGSARGRGERGDPGRGPGRPRPPVPRDSASGSSTSRRGRGRTSASSSTASRCPTWPGRSAPPTRS